ncbi:MAG TPA: hypothetical protein VNK43_05815, partial [Gemmatimonadales bacterium]|nr:hypothetical protein [Gemmatimonadales bacterium]
DPAAVEGLIALAQALNGPTRCALITLRGGGNRSGADVALTMQTGFPFAVDLNRGYPRYRPEESAAALLASRRIDRVLVVGDPRRVPTPVAERLGAVPTAVVGPFASDAPFPTALAVDTAVAGIHEGGIAYRMDDVPLPLRPALDGPPAAVQVLEALAARLAARRGAEVA